MESSGPLLGLTTHVNPRSYTAHRRNTTTSQENFTSLYQKVVRNAPTGSYSGPGAETLTAAPRQKMEALSELSCRRPSEMSSNRRGKIFFLLLKHDFLSLAFSI